MRECVERLIVGGIQGAGIALSSAMRRSCAPLMSAGGVLIDSVIALLYAMGHAPVKAS